MTLPDLIRSIKRRLVGSGRTSYSQCGEDLIAGFLLQAALGLPKPRYLDIGANDPVHFNNTYYFYRQGCAGVCVEPNPKLSARIRRVRPRDVCLAAGVGVSSAASAAFHVLSSATLSTFSREEAEQQVRTANQRIEEVIQVPLLATTEIVTKHCGTCPNFVSLDTEGMDLAILRSWDFERFRPELFCVETLTHPDERKVRGVQTFLKSQGYLLFADTYINSLFVDHQAWVRRRLEGDLTLAY